MKKYIVILLFIFFIIETSYSQYRRDHLFIGLGPSVLYGDNTGNFRELDFKALPALTFGYSYDLANRIDIRASVGAQLFDGAGIRTFPQQEWIPTRQAYDSKGLAIFADVMPVFYLNPDMRRNRHKVNYYVGIGLGMMQVEREVKIGVLVANPEEGGPYYASEMERQNTTSLYFPLRAGISTNRVKGWDFGVEGSILASTSSDLDGNHYQSKSIKQDMLLQIQLVVKHNLDIW